MTPIRFAPAIIAATLCGMAATATPAEQQTATAENPAAAVSADSCAAAFATIMAQYLRPEIDKQFPADTAAISEFTRGVAHAFDVKTSKPPSSSVRATDSHSSTALRQWQTWAIQSPRRTSAKPSPRR